MTKDPAVLFYTSDFISGTQFFTDEQCGQYIRLLCQQHQLGHIPDSHIRQVLKSENNPVWSKFKKDDSGLWYQERMDIEKIKRLKYTESRRMNVKHRYEATYVPTHEATYVPTHEATYVPTYDLHMENGNENRNININTKDIYISYYDKWNEKMPWKIKQTGSRDRHLKSRLQEEDFIKYYDLILEKILNSDFLLGKRKSEGHQNFRASFDWVIKNDTNWVKILEGVYDNNGGNL